MRLVTVSTEHGPRACVEWQGEYVDIHAADPGLPSRMRDVLALGTEGLERVRAATASGSVRYEAAGAKLLAPVPDPVKIVCLGLNYRDHAEESGMAIPTEPILFSKYATSVIGPGATIELPKVSTEVDYEAELVYVIGKRGRDIPRESAMEYIVGYTIGHDVSARDWQLNKPGKQWMAGKTFDTFAPIGPAIVTLDELPDPHSLGIRLRLNGETMQDSSTNQLIFKADETIAYLSQIFTLEPGDLIFTGTPPGVGMARKPPVWLKAGDFVEVEIDGLGVLSNPVAARL